MKEQSNETLREMLLADNDVRESISTRAYEIYQSRGGELGHDLDDWLQAESEVLTALMGQESPDLGVGRVKATAENRDLTRQAEALLSEAAPRKRKS